MSAGPDDELRINRLQAEMARLQAENDRLRGELAARVGPDQMAQQELMEGSLFISEVEVRRAIARQLQNGARLLQANKCVYLLFDGTDELVAQRPALGVDEDQLTGYRVPVNRGVSGEVFRTRKSVRCADLSADPRALEEPLTRLGATNGICVPLMVQIRDEENRVIDSKAIGVLWVMNRRRQGDFSDDDERLLMLFGRQVASVISNAKVFVDMLRVSRTLESTFENLPAGILFIGSDERVRLLNGPARQLFGVEEMRSVGEPYYRVVTHQPTCDVLQGALRDDEDKVAEVPFEVEDEDRVFQIQAARVRDEDEALDGVVAIFNDVTEIHRLDRMKQEFVQTFSTELLGPLASIQGFATMLQRCNERFEAPFRADVHGIINNECSRLRRHIQDLLNVSRFEHGIKLHLNLSRIDFPALLHRVVEHEMSRSRRHIGVVDGRNGEVPVLVGDEPRLEEVLSNLLTNAVKYSPDGGDVTVRLEVRPEGLHVEVADQGVGIPAEHHEAVFQKFARLTQTDERVRGGRGIGLFISRVFVEAHGGRVGVRSEVGQGSTFWFTVPYEPPREEHAEDDAEGEVEA
ncbi:MAG: GAF domain-containing protein [Armatimonadetes bacterium]|nr:GAF domain-containing protein [Armatimonadota bacterium]